MSLEIAEPETVETMLKSGRSKEAILKSIKRKCDDINTLSSGLSYLLHRSIQEDLSAILLYTEVLSKMKVLLDIK